MNFGDRFSLPVVLQNQTASPLEVDVVARADNLFMSEPRALRVTVPANDRVEVRFPAATVSAGTARLQIGAVSPAGDDASEIELPVWTPATTEAFATYGQIDQGAIGQPVKMPKDVFKEFGNVEITTSSTALQGLTDALLYLVRYPFECNEQISSRILTIAALRDVLGAFDAENLPPPKMLNKTVADDIEKLKSRQNWSGAGTTGGAIDSPCRTSAYTSRTRSFAPKKPGIPCRRSCAPAPSVSSRASAATSRIGTPKRRAG